jgi:hypothetical protein
VPKSFVHGDGYTELIQLGQRLDDRLGILQDDAFGDFQLQPVGLEPGLGENPVHQAVDILGLELRGVKD